MNHSLQRYVLLLLLLFTATQTHSLSGADWSVPMAGNAFRTGPSPGNQGFHRDRGIAWGDPESVYSVFFRIDRPADLELAIRARSSAGRLMLATRVDEEVFQTPIEGGDLTQRKIGRIHLAKAGYVRVDFQIEEREGQSLAEIHDVLVSSKTEELALDYVKTNDGNMFYWGRRGPSVHLRYGVPRDDQLQFAYSEITVPQGQDPIGSYFMANGFGEGYFGIQVNGPEERRVLFSVWSPFRTDNPRDIPKDQQIVVLAKGTDVRTGEFGNEGSGGQSFLVYPWKSGTTYRFLTEVKPDGDGNTIYTSWFGDKSRDKWRLIASFRRPKTDTYLSGFHAFLENFAPTYGHLSRRALYGNVWVRDTDGRWHECTNAKFSVDATGRGRHRLDFAGGSEGEHFFLRNGGFFDEASRVGATFARDANEGEQPEINFETLPRG